MLRPHSNLNISILTGVQHIAGISCRPFAVRGFYSWTSALRSAMCGRRQRGLLETTRPPSWLLAVGGCHASTILHGDALMTVQRKVIIAYVLLFFDGVLWLTAVCTVLWGSSPPIKYYRQTPSTTSRWRRSASCSQRSQPSQSPRTSSTQHEKDKAITCHLIGQ